MELHFLKLELPEEGTLVFPIADDLKFTQKIGELNNSLGGAIEKAIKASDFKAKKGKCLSILGMAGKLDRIVLLGTGGEKDGIEFEVDVQNLGGKLFDFLNSSRVKEATVIIEEPVGGFSPDFVSANISYGIKLKSYRFDRYFTKQKEDEKPSLKTVDFMLNASTGAAAKYHDLEKTSLGVFLARDVVSAPPNDLNPETYPDICKELKVLGVKVEVLDEKDMKKLGMNALLAVGEGSSKESHLVVMQWNGSPKKDNSNPIAFVGKGVTFDTGGISIKPSNGMEDMKYDMAGSAAVVGLIKALAERKAKVNVVGVIGLVENMPGGSAQRPSDIVTSMSGQTIEVLNTDAEGRLVLADALWYTQNRFKPKYMIDLATLTGAVVVALGIHNAGLLSNDDDLSDKILDAGKATGETLWRLPLSKQYDKQLDSKIADVQNISNIKGGGTITAGQFLKRFVNDTPWAHIDIAAVAWAEKNLDLVPEGATGFGVRLLDKLIADNYET